MGISLNGLTPAGTYPGLIKTGDNTAISGTPKVLSDGNGNNLPMEVSTTGVNLTGSPTVNSVAIANTTQLATKQDTLVSGTNIKTINGTSVLGSGNIPVVTSPSGVAGAIQFSDGSAFASDAANFFWNNTTKRLGVGTNAPTSTVSIQNTASDILSWSRVSGSTGYLAVTNIRSGAGQGTVFGIDQFSFRNTSGENYIVSELNRLGIGTNNDALTARATIKGSGSTSATTSLLVQNSAGTQSLKVTDDGSVFNYGKGAISSNTAFGEGAIANNTSGTQITAFGTGAAGSNTTGIRNTAFGNAALTLTSTGSSNNAFGYRALVLNTSGSSNTAMGDLALERTTASNNTGFGAASLQNTSSGSGNVGIGANALNAHTTGSNNSALGFNTASGNFSGSVILGHAATATANNQFVVGSSTTNAGSVTTESNLSLKVWNVIINGVAQKILLA
jgi:hypothetical protein